MNQSMGAVIARLRKEKGLTQLELAEKMGVTDKAVSKWERDLSCPDVASIPLLAELLGVSADQLLQGQAPAEKQDLLNLIFRAVALAMGIAVVVTNLLGGLELKNGLTMLGVGLAAMAAWALRQK